MDKEIRIFLLDDHQLMLDGIRSLLQDVSEIEIVGEATSAELALKIIPSLNIDMVITDINMKGMNGIEFTHYLKKQIPEIKVMVLSMSAEEHFISDMLHAGVSGYVVKNTSKDELLKAIFKIASGGKHFSSEVAESIFQHNLSSSSATKDLLTLREKEILRLITKEYSNEQIAEKLFISERTVESHRKNIFRKTGTKTIVGLIKYAIENGFGE